MASEYFAMQEKEQQRSNPKPRSTRVAPVNPVPKENRDPNNLNSHLEYEYYSVFGEPQNTPQSIDCIWEFSEIAFDCCKDCWYKLIGLFCGVCIAIGWAIEFAPLIFTHIWCLTPFAQSSKIFLNGCCRPIWFLCAQLCVVPCTSSCAYLFHNFGTGKMTRPPTPSIFPDRPKRKPVPKPVEKKEKEPNVDKKETVVAVPVVAAAGKREFGDFDREKIAISVKRQLML